MSEMYLDFSDVPEVTVSDGWHSAIIFNVEARESQQGNRMLSVQVKLTHPTFDGEIIYDNWMLETRMKRRTKKYFRNLGLLDEATGKVDLSELKGLSVEVRTRLKPSMDGDSMEPSVVNYRIPTGEADEDVDF